jgi:hypothetical protein
MKKPLGLGDGLCFRMLVPCPRCDKRHRVLQRSEGSLLNQVKCGKKLLVVGIEERYLPQVN